MSESGARMRKTALTYWRTWTKRCVGDGNPGVSPPVNGAGDSKGEWPDEPNLRATAFTRPINNSSGAISGTAVENKTARAIRSASG